MNKKEFGGKGQMRDEYEKVVRGLSRLIRQARLALEDECTSPSRGGPDQSDGFIKNEEERVKVLCRLRDEFETIQTRTSTVLP